MNTKSQDKEIASTDKDGDKGLQLKSRITIADSPLSAAVALRAAGYRDKENCIELVQESSSGQLFLNFFGMPCSQDFSATPNAAVTLKVENLSTKFMALTDLHSHAQVGTLNLASKPIKIQSLCTDEFTNCAVQIDRSHHVKKITAPSNTQGYQATQNGHATLANVQVSLGHLLVKAMKAKGYNAQKHCWVVMDLDRLSGVQERYIKVYADKCPEQRGNELKNLVLVLLLKNGTLISKEERDLSVGQYSNASGLTIEALCSSSYLKVCNLQYDAKGRIQSLRH